MKNKGFTLIELLGVMIILSILAFLVSQVIITNIKNTNDELIETAENMIISAAREHVNENLNDFPKKINNVYCITYSLLESNGRINSDMLPKISEVDQLKAKYIKIIYNGNLHEYSMVDSCVERRT